MERSGPLETNARGVSKAIEKFEAAIAKEISLVIAKLTKMDGGKAK